MLTFISNETNGLKKNASSSLAVTVGLATLIPGRWLKLERTLLLFIGKNISHLSPPPRGSALRSVPRRSSKDAEEIAEKVAKEFGIKAKVYICATSTFLLRCACII